MAYVLLTKLHSTCNVSLLLGLAGVLSQWKILFKYGGVPFQCPLLGTRFECVKILAVGLLLQSYKGKASAKKSEGFTGNGLWYCILHRRYPIS